METMWIKEEKINLNKGNFSLLPLRSMKNTEIRKWCVNASKGAHTKASVPMTTKMRVSVSAVNGQIRPCNYFNYIILILTEKSSFFSSYQKSHFPSTNKPIPMTTAVGEEMSIFNFFHFLRNGSELAVAMEKYVAKAELWVCQEIKHF